MHREALQDDVVAVAGQLGVLEAAFESDVHAADSVELRGQRGEVVRVQQQFPLVGAPALHGLADRARLHDPVCAVQFYRRVQ